MRQASISAMRHDRKNKALPEGKLGQLRELFLPAPRLVSWREVKAIFPNYPSTSMDRLRDFYGMDIRRHSRGRYWLVGEWDEQGNYVDYLAPHI